MPVGNICGLGLEGVERRGRRGGCPSARSTSIDAATSSGSPMHVEHVAERGVADGHGDAAAGLRTDGAADAGRRSASWRWRAHGCRRSAGRPRPRPRCPSPLDADGELERVVDLGEGVAAGTRRRPPGRRWRRSAPVLQCRLGAVGSSVTVMASCGRPVCSAVLRASTVPVSGRGRVVGELLAGVAGERDRRSRWSRRRSSRVALVVGRGPRRRRRSP